MTQENEFTKGANPLCPDDHLWSTRDEQSSEDEVNGFLYSLIRLIKPKFVVETGCYLGDGTLEIARALKDNGRGRLISCDTVQERVDAANKRIADEGLDKGEVPVAIVLRCKGIDLINQVGALIDFAFIDSSPAVKDRAEEIKALRGYLLPLKMFALHDTASQHEGIAELARSIDLPNVYFNTPRGLNLFTQK